MAKVLPIGTGGVLRRTARWDRQRGRPDRNAGRHRRIADHGRQGRAVLGRRTPESAMPADTTCTPPSCSAPGMVLARLRDGGLLTARRPADLPAGRGGQPRRRAGRHRRRRVAGRDGDLRGALRSADRRRPDRPEGPGRSPRRSTRCRITLTGSGGHTSRPHLTADLVGALGALATTDPAGAVPAGRPAQRCLADLGLRAGRLGGQRDPRGRARSRARCAPWTGRAGGGRSS